MAQKRMFSMKIVDSGAFIEMPLSTQCLYFHLNMRADDDGFVDNVKPLMRMVGASEDDLKILLAKSFVLGFESGVIVIKHWRLHNTLQSDRYSPTLHREEKSMLKVDESKTYEFTETKCFQDVSVDKNSIDKNRLDKSIKHPSLEDIEKYIEEKGYKVNAKQFYDYYDAGGWRDKDGKPVKSWKQKVITWNGREIRPTASKPKSNFKQRDNNLDESIVDDFNNLMKDL